MPKPISPESWKARWISTLRVYWGDSRHFWQDGCSGYIEHEIARCVIAYERDRMTSKDDGFIMYFLVRFKNTLTSLQAVCYCRRKPLHVDEIHIYPLRGFDKEVVDKYKKEIDCGNVNKQIKAIKEEKARHVARKGKP